MNLLSVNPNVKFTDLVLIRSSSKNDLRDILSRNANDPGDNLCKAIELGWKNHMIELLKLIRPDVMVSNSVDLSWFLENKIALRSREKQDDIIDIKLGDFTLPCVLSGQVTGQRATDKWTLIRLRNSIINAIKS